MRTRVLWLVATMVGSSCVRQGAIDGGATEEELDASFSLDASFDAGAAGDAGPRDGGDASVDPHVCQRVVSTDAGALCVSIRDVTNQFFAIEPNATYLSVLGARGDRSFVVRFGTTLPDGGSGEGARAGVWSADWNVSYFAFDARSVALNEADESGNLCDCAIMGSPSTGYTCSPRVWLADGGAYEGVATGACVSLDGDLWMSNGIFTWLFVGSTQTRLVPENGGLNWERVHLAKGHAILSGQGRIVVMTRDAGIVHQLPATTGAEATRVSRSGVVAGVVAGTFARDRPVVWPDMFGEEVVDVTTPFPDNLSGFGFMSVANDGAFCATQSRHAVFYLRPGAPPILDDDLGLVEGICGAAMVGGRFLVFQNSSQGGVLPMHLLRVTACTDNCQ